MRVARIQLSLCCCLLLAAGGCRWMERVTVSPSGADSNGTSGGTEAPAISDDGRFVAFMSDARNLVAGDVNGGNDVFVRDLRTNVTVRASVGLTPGGDQDGVDINTGVSISGDGRYVAFTSSSDDLVTDPNSGGRDVFVRDLTLGITTLVSVAHDGGPADQAAQITASISADGRYVAFASEATNLVEPVEAEPDLDVFVRDLQLGVTTRASESISGGEPNGDSQNAEISGDGRIVVFVSHATNLVTGDNNGFVDVFARDLANELTERVSTSHLGGDSDGDSNVYPHTDDQGRFVAFDSGATNLTPTDPNPSRYDMFVRDLQTDTTEAVQMYGNITSISGNGRYLGFESSVDGQLPGDVNYWSDGFVQDLQNDRAVLVTRGPSGQQGNLSSGGPVLSRDGRYAAFVTDATNFLVGDQNNSRDIYVRALLPPRIDSATPRPIPRGISTIVTINGVGFIDGVSARILDPDGVAIDSIEVIDSAEIRLTVSTTADASTGPRRLVLWNPGTGPGLSATSYVICARCIEIQGET